jgi:hypothetical protein
VAISYLYYRCTFLGQPNHLSTLNRPCFWEKIGKNFKHTSYKYEYFCVQSCPIRSLYNMSRTFPLQEASLELNFCKTVIHRLPLNFNYRNFHRKKSQGARSCKGVMGNHHHVILLKFVEKTQSCDLAPCRNVVSSLFVLFDQRFLPNCTFKVLKTPKQNSFKKETLFLRFLCLLEKYNILQIAW